MAYSGNFIVAWVEGMWLAVGKAGTAIQYGHISAVYAALKRFVPYIKSPTFDA